MRLAGQVRELPIAVHFDLVDLRLLVNIAEVNSLTRGAAKSNLSLPAASLRIKNIEDSLGAKLLYRTSQGVTLTPVGQAFTQHARLVLQQLEHLRADLQGYAQGIKGHVRIFANTTAINFIPRVLSTYLASHPGVDVDLRERGSPDIVRAVSDGSADIGIVSGAVRIEGLQAIPYHRERLVLATSLQHPLANKVQVAFEETLQYEYVSLYEASAIHSFVSQFAPHALKIRIQVGSFESVCRMVEANVGIGLLPESAAQRYSRVSAIRIIELSDMWAMREMQICVRNLELLPVFARDLIELLIADVARGPETDSPRAVESAGPKQRAGVRARTSRSSSK
jgi:DNA-binding transcriptional LysR family regulator